MNDPTTCAPATSLLDNILDGGSIECSDLFQAVLREMLQEVEKWVGRDIVLECDARGWAIRFTHGNSYRDRLTDCGSCRFCCAEDAIQALTELCAKNKAEVEREEAVDD